MIKFILGYFYAVPFITFTIFLIHVICPENWGWLNENQIVVNAMICLGSAAVAIANYITYDIFKHRF
jgi:hypothetical protein